MAYVPADTVESYVSTLARSLPSSFFSPFPPICNPSTSSPKTLLASTLPSYHVLTPSRSQQPPSTSSVHNHQATPATLDPFSWISGIPPVGISTTSSASVDHIDTLYPPIDPYALITTISSHQSPTSSSPSVWDPLVAITSPESDMARFNASSRSSPAPMSAVPPTLMSFSSHGTEDSAQDSHLGAILSKERQQIYLQAYWRCFHPFFPILHKQRLQNGNKLHGRGILGAVMMAIGAQYTHEFFAGSDSRILHERATEAMSKVRCPKSAHCHLLTV